MYTPIPYFKVKKENYLLIFAQNTYKRRIHIKYIVKRKRSNIH